MTALGQLFGQHVPRNRYDDEGHPVGTYCICGGWEGDYFADGEAGPFDEHLAAVVLAWVGDEYRRGLTDAMDVVQSEARWQWELDARRSVGAQIVAQRMEVVWKVLQGFQERHQHDAGVKVAPGATDELAGAQIACWCGHGPADHSSEHWTARSER